MHARSPQYQVLNSRAVTGRRLQNKRARDASTRHPSHSNRKRPAPPAVGLAGEAGRPPRSSLEGRQQRRHDRCYHGRLHVVEVRCEVHLRAQAAC